MHTAIEYDQFSSMFYLNSPISPGKLVTMHDSALTAVAEDKEMKSPSVWTSSSATQMSSPSIYSDSSISSSIAGEDLRFVRSRTPSPESDFRGRHSLLRHSPCRINNVSFLHPYLPQ